MFLLQNLRLTNVASLYTEMDTCFLETLLFRLFIGFGWIEKQE